MNSECKYCGGEGEVLTQEEVEPGISAPIKITKCPHCGPDDEDGYDPDLDEFINEL